MPGPLKVVDLRCEYLVDPLGIDERRPRLSWVLESDSRCAKQVARRIMVASSAQLLAEDRPDLWDSGRVEDDQTCQIPYMGVQLDSRQRCYWQVQVWDEQGYQATSGPAFWTMGLLNRKEWLARWIKADPRYLEIAAHAVKPTPTQPGTPAWFRKVFRVSGAIRSATLYASARGLFECYINDQRVGDDLFAPEWTDYSRRIHYRTYDVTGLIRPGSNVVGAILGDGWYSGFVGWQEKRGRYGLDNSILIQLEIELADGSRQLVLTDHSWRSAAGPIIWSDLQMGEAYDARYELTGWQDPQYDDSGWCGCLETDWPDAELVWQRSEPVKIVELIRPVAVDQVRPGVFIFDLGQNITGFVRLRVRGPAGTKVTLRHGERLNPDGSLYTANLRRAKATDIYVLKGRGQEVWQPRFTFHGFQYVELAGLPYEPDLDTITGCVLHSALRQTGWFECSEPLVNRLWLNILWSQKDNFVSIPTDCPQRDERLGWTGDAQVFCRTASYNMDVAAFFSKWMIDVQDAQTQEGVFPDTAPRLPEGGDFVGLDGLCGAAGWADAGVIVPWTIWRMYGDTRIIERHYEAMVRWLEYLERTNPDGVRRNELGNNYGDWLCIPSDTSFRTHSPMKTLLATAYWATDASRLAAMAGAIGRYEDAARFQAMFERVRKAFQREFLQADGRLGVETQTAYLLALAFDLLPEQVRPLAGQRLIELIAERNWHLSTGFIGVGLLNPVLTELGRPDVAWRLLLNEDYPSWLYPVKHGATTIWERWNGWTQEQGFFDPQMNSFNHYSLGSVGEWLFRYAAGIDLDKDINGFRRFVIRPCPDRRLDRLSARYRSIRGIIESCWQWQGDHLLLSVAIPANTEAKVYVPSEPGSEVLEGDLRAGQVRGIESLGRQGGFAVFHVMSGRYRFTSELRSCGTLFPAASQLR